MEMLSVALLCRPELMTENAVIETGLPDSNGNDRIPTNQRPISST